MIEVKPQFLDTPLVTLVNYGCPMRVINKIEAHYGHSVRHLVDKDDKDLLAVHHINKTRLQQFKQALRKYYQELHGV